MDAQKRNSAESVLFYIAHRPIDPLVLTKIVDTFSKIYPNERSKMQKIILVSALDCSIMMSFNI